MKRKILFMTLALVVLTFFGCKPPKEFIDSIKTTPNPAEYKAGKVEVVFEGTFPEKYFKKNMIMTVTPYIQTADGEIYEAESVVYQGEKIKDNNEVISYKVGGKYTQTSVWDYKDGMEDSKIFIKAKGTVGKKEFELDPVEVATGVNITPLLVSTQPGTGDLKAAITADKFQRIIEERTDAQIKFLVNQADVRNSELKSEQIKALTAAIKAAKEAENRELKGLNISSYASPEGTLEFNEKLSDNRGKNSEKYINKQLKKLKAEVAIDSKFTAEDWEGFKELVEASNIEDKALILRVLSMYQDPEQREKEIKNLAAAYKTIDEIILPELRRSKMTLVVDIIGKSDEEIASLAKTDVAQLNVEELLYAATLTQDYNEKAEIYSKVIEIYPDEVRGVNNLGMVYYEQGKLADAKRLFAKALKMTPDCPSVNFNNGLIALAENDIEKAEEFFGKAGGVGEGLDYANGAIAILKGNYKKAAELFGNSTSNNAALANLLNKNNGAARKALENNENANATTAYIKAILAARTNNKDNFNAAKAELEQNEALKARAEKDVEFMNMK